MGRKRKNRDEAKLHYVAVRFSSKLLNTLDLLAKLSGTSRSDIVRRLVQNQHELIK